VSLSQLGNDDSVTIFKLRVPQLSWRGVQFICGRRDNVPFSASRCRHRRDIASDKLYTRHYLCGVHPVVLLTYTI
jgi:hypothetical protein